MSKPINLMVINDDPTPDGLNLALDPRKFNIFTSTTQLVGPKIFTKQNPDVVLIDLLNPQPDGLQVCRELRQFSQIPILIISIIGKSGMVEKALNAGADEYLVKPVPTNILVAYLNTFARRSRAEKIAVNAIIQAGAGNQISRTCTVSR